MRTVSIVRPPPVLDVAAIERDVPMDADMRGFDGRSRRRRMVIFLVVAIVLVFGGMFALLADSYTPKH